MLKKLLLMNMLLENNCLSYFFINNSENSFIVLIFKLIFDNDKKTVFGKAERPLDLRL